MSMDENLAIADMASQSCTTQIQFEFSLLSYLCIHSSIHIKQSESKNI